jgi:hypothetical protein
VKPLTALTAILLGGLALAAPAMAATEAGDAGDLPGTAQDLSGAAVDAIDGNIGAAGDQDLYRVCVEGGGTFSATTVGGTQLDTQLFLFDASGMGVYGNDDSQATRQSTLPAFDVLTPVAPGVYLLAVTPYDRDPQSDSGAIFGSGGLLAPTGPGAGDPLSAWEGREGLPGDYRITLTGTAGCAPPPDETPPAIDLRSPVDGAVYLLGEHVVADYGCSDDALATCAGDVPDGAPVDTSSVGGHTFTVRASDASGNSASASAGYRVIHDFRFLWPVKSRPEVNRVRAGRVALVRFSLDGFHGRRVLAAGYPRVAEIECGSSAEPASGEPARVRRVRARHGYAFLWKTRRSWAGTCRQLILGLDDGTVHRADYLFTRRR